MTERLRCTCPKLSGAPAHSQACPVHPCGCHVPVSAALVIGTAQEAIPAGAYIEIDARTGKVRVARFGDATAAQIGEQELAR